MLMEETKTWGLLWDCVGTLHAKVKAIINRAASPKCAVVMVWLTVRLVLDAVWKRLRVALLFVDFVYIKVNDD